jgi:hypothetical protein
MTATLQSYTTGTVAVTKDSDIVTLTGGTWLESWCVPGSDMRIAGESTAMVIEEWIDTTHVRLSIPIQRATASGLTYAILMTSPAFGTNRLGALTAVERIRLMTENVVISQLLGVASGGLAAPALQDRIGIWDASDSMNAKPGTLAAALQAGTSVLTKSANYAVTADDYGSLITMSAGTGARTVTLPAAATAGAGFVIGIKKTDASANAVTIARSGSSTIDGATSLALTVQYGTVILRCDGTNWHVVVLENTSAFARTLLDDANAATMQATLGVAPKQASVTDTTAGAGLIVGAFGLGGQVVSSETNINNYLTSGSYITPNGGLTNLPPGWVQARHNLDVSGGISYATQVITNPTGGQRAWRGGVAGIFGAWQPVLFPLGTVSQSGGFPTGGLLERGSNSNGEYVRYADGTQICWNTNFSLSYLNATIYQNTWTFPAGFISEPAKTASMREWNPWPNQPPAYLTTRSAGGAINTQVQLWSSSLPTTQTTASVSLIAIGRWF